MLALDDERWRLLSHAWGDASDIPEILLELRENFKSGEEEDLIYGHLCHQNSTYSATFAAVPHLVEIALEEQMPQNQADIVIFCGMVHALRNYDRRYKIASEDRELVAKLAEEIEAAYSKAVEKIAPLAGKLFEIEHADEELPRYIFFSFLAFHGQEKLSRKFFEFSRLDEFIFECSHCENEIYLWAEDDKLVAYKEDAVFNKSAEKFALSPVKIDWRNWTGEYSDEQKANWMMYLAETYDIAPLNHQIPYLFSEMFCPHCRKSIKILDSLIDSDF